MNGKFVKTFLPIPEKKKCITRTNISNLISNMIAIEVNSYISYKLLW